ncbi:MAG TPA: hypothetical protein VGC79_03180 [Polyangiaceae bacterium]
MVGQPGECVTLWSPSAVTLTRGADQLASFSKTERSIRKWCKQCGGHVMTVHPGWDLIDVYAAVIPDLPFKAMLHVNYADSALPIHDGLPKQHDFPSEMGVPACSCRSSRGRAARRCGRRGRHGS